MISLMRTNGFALDLEPDFIESVEEIKCPSACVVTMSSGNEYEVARSYTYVRNILRAAERK